MHPDNLYGKNRSRQLSQVYKNGNLVECQSMGGASSTMMNSKRFASMRGGAHNATHMSEIMTNQYDTTT